MKYRGDEKKLFKLGYVYDVFLDAYTKDFKKSAVIIHKKNKNVDYRGAKSTEMLKELGVLK